MSPKRALGARGAPFADVTPDRKAPPTWIGRHPAPAVASLRPARLPREFSDAARSTSSPAVLTPGRSLLPASKPRGHRVSYPPTASTHPSIPVNDVRNASTSLSAAPPSATQSLLREAEPIDALSSQDLEAFGRALNDLVDARTLLQEASAVQIVDLASMIARRVIAHELSVTPDIIRRLVDDGMNALQASNRLVVRIGEAFADRRSELVHQLGGEVENVEVVVDSALSPYGCIVESEHGWVDESIENRLAALLQALRSESAPP
jgi:hypothetical protein